MFQTPHFIAAAKGLHNALQMKISPKTLFCALESKHHSEVQRGHLMSKPSFKSREVIYSFRIISQFPLTRKCGRIWWKTAIGLTWSPGVLRQMTKTRSKRLNESIEKLSTVGLECNLATGVRDVLPPAWKSTKRDYNRARNQEFLCKSSYASQWPRPPALDIPLLC